MTEQFSTNWKHYQTGGKIKLSNNPQKWTHTNNIGEYLIIGNRSNESGHLQKGVLNASVKFPHDRSYRCNVEGCGIYYQSAYYLQAHQSIEHRNDSNGGVIDCLSGQWFKTFIDLGEYWIFWNTTNRRRVGGNVGMYCQFAACVNSTLCFVNQEDYIAHIYNVHQGKDKTYPLKNLSHVGEHMKERYLSQNVKHGRLENKTLWIGPYSYDWTIKYYQCKAENLLRGRFYNFKCSQRECDAIGVTYLHGPRTNRVEIGSTLSKIGHNHVPAKLEILLGVTDLPSTTNMMFQNYNFKKSDVFDLEGSSKIGFIRYKCRHRNCSIEVWAKVSDEKCNLREISYWITEGPHFHSAVKIFSVSKIKSSSLIIDKILKMQKKTIQNLMEILKLYRSKTGILYNEEFPEFSNIPSNVDSEGLNVKLQDKTMYKIFKEKSSYYEEHIYEHLTLLGHTESNDLRLQEFTSSKRVRAQSIVVAFEDNNNGTIEDKRSKKRRRHNSEVYRVGNDLLDVSPRETEHISNISSNADSESSDSDDSLLADVFKGFLQNDYNKPNDGFSGFSRTVNNRTEMVGNELSPLAERTKPTTRPTNLSFEELERKYIASSNKLKNSYGNVVVYEKELEALKELWKLVVDMGLDETRRNTLSFLSLKSSVEILLKCIVLLLRHPFTLNSKIQFLHALGAHEDFPESLRELATEVLQCSNVVLEVNWLVFLAKLAESYMIKWEYRREQGIPVPSLKDVCPIDLYTIGEECKTCPKCCTKYCVIHDEFCLFCDFPL